MRGSQKTKFLPKQGIEPGTPSPQASTLSTELSLHTRAADTKGKRGHCETVILTTL